MKASLLTLVWYACALMRKIEGSTLSITTKFNDGDVTFMWNGAASNYTVSVYKDRDGGNTFNVNETQYTVKNATLHDKIMLDVKLKTSNKWDTRETYQVSKIKAKVGDSVNMSWTAPFFPNAGTYTIYHTGSVNRSIITVTKTDAKFNESKYNYTSRPFNSTNISLSMRDITLQDAGYYAGGISSDAAWSGGGVVLIVLGKPKINGNLSIPVGINSELTCSSNLSFAPDYYAKLVKMNYTWFENDTRLNGETGQNLTLKVTKNHRYNRYTCTARDNQLESDRSDAVQINPLYKPDKVTITPQPPLNDRETVKEGETIGPYNCSADCNPPCSITWKLKDTDGSVTDAVSVGKTELSQQIVNRNMSLFRCVAKYDEINKIKYNISLDIQYLDQPSVFMNGQQILNKNNTLQISERNPIHISCFVNSNPDPHIQLRKNGINSVTNQSNTQWLNHTLESPQCSDSGTYKCVGISTGFNSTEKTFEIDVTCKPRIDGTIKERYGSRSGQNITVVVSIIGNPPPQESNITWSGPVENLRIKSTVTQQDVSYKHWINSSIPIIDQNYFGNYTLKYNGNLIFTIIINAEDVPQPPTNFTGYSDASGYINLTWLSRFNGGPEQHFILSKKEDSEWKFVKNISDPGEGKVVYFSYGPLEVDTKYWYSLKSCNRINCSSPTVETNGTIQANQGPGEVQPSPRSKTSNMKIIIIGISVALAVIVLVITVFVTRCLLNRKKTERRHENAEVVAAEGNENEPDVVMYAVVDKNHKKATENNADVVADDVLASNQYEQEVLYSNTEKGNPIISKPSRVKKVKGMKKEVLEQKKQEDNVPSAKHSTGKCSTSNTNQDGLIYIDVEFANKSDNQDRNEKPLIHGEEDRTEYTFVDFSRKAPPLQENEEDE